MSDQSHSLQEAMQIAAAAGVSLTPADYRKIAEIHRAGRKERRQTGGKNRDHSMRDERADDLHLSVLRFRHHRLFRSPGNPAGGEKEPARGPTLIFARNAQAKRPRCSRSLSGCPS